MEQPKHIKLNLTIDQVNTVIKALAGQPFQEVYELIGEIHTQSNQQLKGATQLSKEYKEYKEYVNPQS